MSRLRYAPARQGARSRRNRVCEGLCVALLLGLFVLGVVGAFYRGWLVLSFVLAVILGMLSGVGIVAGEMGIEGEGSRGDAETQRGED